MAERRIDEVGEVMKRTKNGCDKNCKECLMFLPNVDMCFHEAERKWQKWNIKEHDRFNEILRGNQ